MSSRFSWQKVGVTALIAVVLAGGALAYMAFFGASTGRTLASGERAYEQGVQALEANKAETAVLRFDEAILQAKTVLDETEKEQKSGQQLSETRQQRLTVQEGRAYWLKARALRDKAFAEAAAAGKPLKETQDTTYGGTFRSILGIPDAEARTEAVMCMRQAGVRMSGMAEIQKEALRTEVMLSPMPWGMVSRFAQQLLDLEDDNSRALYQMAVFEYEQPGIDARGGVQPPLPLEKRSAKRMLEARGYIERLKKSSESPFWRTTELDSRISVWLREHYQREGKSENRLAEEKRLLAIYKDSTEKAADAGKLADLPIFDARAVLTLHRLMLNDAVRAVKNPKSEAVKTVESQLDQNLALCSLLGKKTPPSGPFAEEATRSAVQALGGARPVLKDMPEDKWEARAKIALDLAELAKTENVSNPDMYTELVRFLDREAKLAGRRGDAKRSGILAKQATEWLKSGLDQGEKAGLTPQRMADLHALAVELKQAAGAAPKDLAPHLDVLRKLQGAPAQAMAKFLEGVTLERQGRLDSARKLLEESEKLGMSTGRIDPVLASLYLALDMPAQALTRLQRMYRDLAQVDQLTETERAWAEEFVRSKEDLQALLVVVNLETAKRAALRYQQQNPGQPIPMTQVEGYEKEARRLLAGLADGTVPNRNARVGLIRYLTQLNRKEEATKELQIARQKSPDSVELLQLEVLAYLLPAQGKTTPVELSDADRGKIDKMIQNFIKSYPTSVVARLLWAEWLNNTKRAEQAAAYLKDPANIPGDKDDRYRRLLALSLINKGDRSGGVEVLRQLPSTPQIDMALIQLTAAREERAQQLSQAMKRHERNGLLGCMEGLLALESRKWKEAGESFFQALEYTQARRMAEAGLRVALFAQAQTAPGSTREEITRLMALAPTEKILYLSYAYASLLLEDLGTPFQDWTNNRSMGSALNQWYNLQTRDGGDAVEAALLKAEFWGQGGRGDVAWAEVSKLLRDRPKDARALQAGIQLALVATDGGQFAQGKKMVTDLLEVAPEKAEHQILATRYFLREKDFATAKKTIGEVLEKDPKNDTAYGLLAEAVLALKDTQGASELATTWTTKLPESLTAQMFKVQHLAATGKSEEAVRVMRESLITQGKQWREQAGKLTMPEGMSADAWKKQIEEGLTQRIANLDVEFCKALVRGNSPLADANVKAVVEKYPGHIPALLLQGDMALAKQDWKAARASYEEVLKKNPRNFVATNNLAWLLAEKFNEAKRAADLSENLLKGELSGKPLTGDRVQLDFLDTLGLVYRKLNTAEGYARMRDLFESARKRYPTDPRMSLALGYALAGLDESRQARVMFRETVKYASLETPAITPEARKALIAEAQEAEKKLDATPSE